MPAFSRLSRKTAKKYKFFANASIPMRAKNVSFEFRHPNQLKNEHLIQMKIKHGLFAAIAAFALAEGASAQNTIGVGVPTGSTRNDTYIAAGFEFYAPTAGTTINALG